MPIKSLISAIDNYELEYVTGLDKKIIPTVCYYSATTHHNATAQKNTIDSHQNFAKVVGCMFFYGEIFDEYYGRERSMVPLMHK